MLVQFATPDHAASLRQPGLTITADDPIDGTEFTELHVPPGTAAAAVDQLRHTPGVVQAEPNAIVEADGATVAADADPYPQGGGISFAEHGSDDETLAVVDTGVDATHPDLAGRVLAGHNAITGSSNAADDNGHGTMVAGIAAANRDNGIGSLGVDPSTKILPVKVLDATGAGTVANIAKGITWAVDHGATVINLSLGSPTDSSTLRSAVNYATARNVVVVAAAGNDGSTTPDYPAAYPGVIAVGAIANDDPLNPMLDDYSNRGSWVSLVAQGDGMIGPLPGNQYGVGSGTSFAAPVVAGTATLVLGKYTGMSAADARRRLESTAADVGAPGRDATYGFGEVSPSAALGGPPPYGRQYDPPPTDPLEPNDGPDRATPLAVGHSISTALETPDDVDWFAIDVPGAGNYGVTIPDALGPVLDLYDSGVHPLSESDPSFSRTNAEVFFTAAAAARYYVSVRYRNATPYTISASSGAVGPSPAQFGAPVQLTGRFADGGVTPTSSPILAADVTGDGRADLVGVTLTPGDPPALRTYPQIAPGMFGAAQDVSAPTNRVGATESGIAAGDFDGDGKTDVAMATPDGVDVFSQRSGRLAAPVVVPLDSPANQVVVADVDGDGRPEIVAETQNSLATSTYPGGVFVLHNTGAAFTASRVVPADQQTLDVGDVTGDGRPDIVGVSQTPVKLPNGGSTTYLTITTFAQQSNGTFAAAGKVTMGEGSASIAVGDVTGDGRADVVLSRRYADSTGTVQDQVRVLRQTTSGTLASPVDYPAATDSMAPALIDLNHDGRLDVVTANNVLLQRRDGTLRPAQSWGLLPSVIYTPAHRGVAAADLTGDGLPDVVATNGSIFAMAQHPTRAPQVWLRAVTPADRTLGVSRTAAVTVHLSGDVTPSSVTPSTVRMADGETGDTVPATFSFDSTSMTVTLTPTARLKDWYPYTVVATAGLADTTGRHPLVDQISTFRTTGAGIDNPGVQVYGSPTNIRAAPGPEGTATVTWTLPSGPLPPTWTVTAGDSSDSANETVPGTSSSAVVHGLVDGRAYRFNVYWNAPPSNWVLPVPPARPSGAYASTIVDSRPSGYWRLGEPPGATSGGDTSGWGRTVTFTGGVALGATGAVSGDANTAARLDGTGTINVPAPWVNRGAAAQTTVELTMNWNGDDSAAPVLLAFQNYGLQLAGGSFGFTTFNGDLVGIPSSGLAGRWVHVVAVFGNGDERVSQLWIDGVRQTLTVRTGAAATGTVGTTASLGHRPGATGTGFVGVLDEIALYDHAPSPRAIASHRVALVGAAPTAPPGAPIGVVPVPAAGGLWYRWTPPLSTGGGVISKYHLVVDGTTAVDVPGTASSAFVALDSAEHTVAITAVTAAGTGRPFVPHDPYFVSGARYAGRYNNQVRADGAVGYWRLDDEPGSSSAADASGFGHPGTYTGRPALGTYPATQCDPDWGAGFDGAHDSLTVATPAVSTAPGADTSVEIWAGWLDPQREQTLVAFGNYRVVLSGGSLAFTSGAGDLWGVDATAAATDWGRIWYAHIVAVFHNGAITSSRLFVNGIAQPMSVRAGSPGSATVTTVARVGADSGGGSYLLGAVDDLSIYRYALTPGEVDYHEELATCPDTSPNYPYPAKIRSAGPLTYWRLGFDDFRIARDLSGHNIHGARSLGVETSTSAIQGDNDPGTGFYGEPGPTTITVPDQSGLRLNGPFTIEFWADRNRTVMARTLLSKGPASSSGGGFRVYSNADGSMHFARDGIDSFSTPAGELYTYKHYAVTYDGSALRWYVDGTLQSATTVAFATDTNTNPFVLGDPAKPGQFDLDEVALYNRALPASEVADHHSVGIAGTPAATPPGAPTNVTATAASNSATVSWTPPSSNGGSALTHYTVMSAPGGLSAQVSGSTTTATVSGLTNGMSYTFKVVATNAIGNGPASAGSNAVISGSSGSLTNGGFETGTLSGWSSVGTTAVTAGGHGGTYGARAGSSSPTNGDSSLAQSFTVPSNAATLSLWYRVTCPDTVQYDWATVTLRDAMTGTTTTVVPKTCTNGSGWVQATANVSGSGGHVVTLTLTSHDDDYAGDATYVDYDDVTVH